MNAGKIAVAMSGGVDSTVAALLLIQQGYEIEGFYLDISEDDEGRQSAKSAASVLGIPLQVIDVGNKFETSVINWMIAEYSSGNTPNPCVHCNKTIKWGYLYKTIEQLGFKKLATGHYARVRYNENGRPQLLTGCDNTKDQSYFLSYLTREDLDHTLFPLGELTKAEVRAIASRHHLPNTTRRESQDLCFMKENMADFLRNRLSSSTQPGEIVDTDGAHLGEHEGLVYYTVGQRKGLRIAHKHALYILGKDYPTNKLIVGPKTRAGYSSLIAREINWIEDTNIDEVLHAQVKIRYRAKPVWAIINLLENNKIQIQFDHPVMDVTPGQVAVMYREEKVLGAGLICEGIP